MGEGLSAEKEQWKGYHGLLDMELDWKSRDLAFIILVYMDKTHWSDCLTPCIGCHSLVAL